MTEGCNQVICLAESISYASTNAFHADEVQICTSTEAIKLLPMISLCCLAVCQLPKHIDEEIVLREISVEKVVCLTKLSELLMMLFYLWWHVIQSTLLMSTATLKWYLFCARTFDGYFSARLYVCAILSSFFISGFISWFQYTSNDIMIRMHIEVVYKPYIHIHALTFVHTLAESQYISLNLDARQIDWLGRRSVRWANDSQEHFVVFAPQ